MWMSGGKNLDRAKMVRGERCSRVAAEGGRGTAMGGTQSGDAPTGRAPGHRD